MQNKILKWFATGRVGLSSKSMACAVAGIRGVEKNYPHDPDDFNRCLLFLKAVPEARNYFDKIARISPEWKAIVKRFDEIEKCFLDEVGLDWKNGNRAAKTYTLMKEVIAEAKSIKPA